MKSTCLRAVALLIVLSSLLCGCSVLSVANTATTVEAGKAVLRTMAETPELENWLLAQSPEEIPQIDIEKLVADFPILSVLTQDLDLPLLFETAGFMLMEEYLGDEDPLVQAHAETLARIIRIFAPELSDQVDEVLQAEP